MSQAGSETDDRVQMTWPVNSADDDEARELARRIEREHPRWIVVIPGGTGNGRGGLLPRRAPGSDEIRRARVPSPETGGVSHGGAKDPGPRPSGFGAGRAEADESREGRMTAMSP